MKLLFGDSWYFIALLNRRDAGHTAAHGLRRTFEQVHLVTHDGVLAEVLSHVCEAGVAARDRATTFVRALLQDSGVTIYPMDRALFLAGLSLYERRRDKGYSLTDCMSMHLMQDHGITHVLTNDHHFRQEGFTVLSDAP